ncbi:MAG: carboxypeptidase regulatory-like domain-containing protein [Treponema sp.]|nr:carboxypeptidase regulatory-like domain-containing protein [Treponema sp.]
MRTGKFIWIFMTFFFISCGSTKFEGKSVLAGKVCDMKGNPVENYYVSAGIGHEAVTDSSGLFAIRDLTCGNYCLKGGGNGWKSVEQTVSFHDRKSIVCIQVESLESMLDEIESLLKEKNYSGARKLLYESKAHNESNPLFLCYRKLIDYCALPSEKRKKDLLSALEKI